jgi:hypothetical protein
VGISSKSQSGLKIKPCQITARNVDPNLTSPQTAKELSAAATEKARLALPGASGN